MRSALQILWQGAREAAVDKPAGLSSERPAAAGSALDCAIERVRVQFGWPDAQLPHRLDRPTSGVLMVAADREQAAIHASEQRDGGWTKWYVARIPARSGAGRAAETLVGAHRAFLRRRGRLAEAVRSGGDPSRLEVLAVRGATDSQGDAHALIRLDTGRFHQVRVMLASLGFPLAGDLDYGGAASRPALQLIAAGLVVRRDPESVAVRIAADRMSGVSAELSRALDDAMREAAVTSPRAPGPTTTDSQRPGH